MHEESRRVIEVNAKAQTTDTQSEVSLLLLCWETHNLHRQRKRFVTIIKYTEESNDGIGHKQEFLDRA